MKKDRSRSREPDFGPLEEPDSDERSEPGDLKAARRRGPRPERPNSPSKPPPKNDEDAEEKEPPGREHEDPDEQACWVCGQNIRGGRVGMRMHLENSTYHRQYMIWNRGNINWNDARVLAKRELKKEWQTRQVKASPQTEVKLTESKTHRQDPEDRARSKEPRRRERSPRRHEPSRAPESRRERRGRSRPKAADRREPDRREPDRRERRDRYDEPAPKHSGPPAEESKKKAAPAAGSAERTGKKGDDGSDPGDSGYSYTYDDESSSEPDVQDGGEAKKTKTEEPAKKVAAVPGARPKAGAVTQPPTATVQPSKASSSSSSAPDTLTAMADFFQAQSQFMRKMSSAQAKKKVMSAAAALWPDSRGAICSLQRLWLQRGIEGCFSISSETQSPGLADDRTNAEKNALTCS